MARYLLNFLIAFNTFAFSFATMRFFWLCGFCVSHLGDSHLLRQFLSFTPMPFVLQKPHEGKKKKIKNYYLCRVSFLSRKLGGLNEGSVDLSIKTAFRVWVRITSQCLFPT